MNSYDIVGYTYKADIYCPACAAETVYNDYELEPYHIPAHSWEGQLKAIAKLVGIDYDDPYSYDSDTYPKVIFADQFEDDHCCVCHERLID